MYLVHKKERRNFQALVGSCPPWVLRAKASLRHPRPNHSPLLATCPAQRPCPTACPPETCLQDFRSNLRVINSFKKSTCEN